MTVRPDLVVGSCGFLSGVPRAAWARFARRATRGPPAWSVCVWHWRSWFVFGSATGFGGAVVYGAPSLGDIPMNRPVAVR